jgi:hypothetical protein
MEDHQEGWEAWLAILEGFRENERSTQSHLETSRELAASFRELLERTIEQGAWSPRMYDLIAAFGKAEAAAMSYFDAAVSVREAVEGLLEGLEGAEGD